MKTIDLSYERKYCFHSNYKSDFIDIESNDYCLSKQTLIFLGLEYQLIG